MMMNAPIILLKEGTEAKYGKQQILSNIDACNVVADSIRTTLGPRGMDKLIVDSKGWLVFVMSPPFSLPLHSFTFHPSPDALPESRSFDNLYRQRAG